LTVLLLAHINTPTAQNTPRGYIFEEGVVLLGLLVSRYLCEALELKGKLQKFCNPLQLTSSIGRALTTIYVVCGQEELKCSSLQSPDILGIRPYNHPLPNSHPT